MAEDDVRLELEAVQAVYGDDSHLICDFPPHLTVHIKPRTADDSSQQFVEATIGIKANTKYPEEPPHIYITYMKGMDDSRQAHWITSIRKRAEELASFPMLVALCEEAVDLLTNMNHPEGNCPLCLYPLVSNDRSGTSLPFMKLMSCYHCFHSECMIRLWKWTQEKYGTKEINQALETSPESVEVQGAQVIQGSTNLQKATCPVCRQVFDAKDIEHVLEYLVINSSIANPIEPANDEEDKAVLYSDLENKRRQYFDAILKLQQEKKGLIEPKKNLVIMAGMFLPESVEPPISSAEEKNEEFTDQPGNHGLELKGGPSMKASPSNSNRRRKGSFRGKTNTESSRKQWAVKPISTSKR
ncbi:E3 ubiquitin-protein ligase RNF25 isoform X2 [Phalaenopsis equestris]|uniref:E3 ubiquitin-protein ligase RNF25 isoform X2 n=1 Tax=Phalaenopsis equestris TaxID=78828 RepID=UPI0009E3F26C|nr:E3 ubiquitin-protein ligase RNF25 isoform X2 [Phalaenopsis equestris]